MFWNNANNKKPINSDEYERLAKRITELVGDIGICKASNEIIRSDLANLRGRFNRQLSGMKGEEEKVEPKEEEKKNESYINDSLVGIG